MQVVKVLFMPVGIISGLIAGLVAKKAFGLVWNRVSSEEPPGPEQREASVPMLVTALALEGAISRVSGGLVEHGARVGFRRVTGAWPGEDEAEAS